VGKMNLKFVAKKREFGKQKRVIKIDSLNHRSEFVNIITVYPKMMSWNIKGIKRVFMIAVRVNYQ
jgi:hypothetical protein